MFVYYAHFPLYVNTKLFLPKQKSKKCYVLAPPLTEADYGNVLKKINKSLPEYCLTLDSDWSEDVG